MTTPQKGRHTGRRIPRKDRNGSIELAHILGAGGEGEVYAVRGDSSLAVKIYHEHRRPKGPMVEKLAAMERTGIRIMGEERAELPPLAWPRQVVQEKGKDQVVGIVMPMVDRLRTVPIAHTLTPTTRRNVLGKHGTNEERFRETRWAMARNLISIVRALHKAGCLIGDVNDENILTNPSNGEISIVDCDAFQVTDYDNKTIHRCKVGRAEFTAPELLDQLGKRLCDSKTCGKFNEEGKHKPEYSCLKREAGHDMFGISVILFKLFMNGAHPYNQKTAAISGSNSTLKDLIAARKYPYTPQEASDTVTAANARLYQELPGHLKTMFHRTFA